MNDSRSEGRRAFQRKKKEKVPCDMGVGGGGKSLSLGICSELWAPRSARAWLPEFSSVQPSRAFGIGCIFIVKDAFWVVGQKLTSADKSFNNDAIYKEYNHNKKRFKMVGVTKAEAVRHQPQLQAAQWSNQATTAAGSSTAATVAHVPASVPAWAPTSELVPVAQALSLASSEPALMTVTKQEKPAQLQEDHSWPPAQYQLPARQRSLSKAYSLIQYPYLRRKTPHPLHENNYQLKSFLTVKDPA